MIPAAGVRPRNGRSRAAGRGRSRVTGRQDGAGAPRLFPDLTDVVESAAPESAAPESAAPEVAAPEPGASEVAVPEPALPKPAQDSGESALYDFGANPAGDSSEASPGEPGSGPTLEKLICELWNEVLNEGRAVCPLCGGEMVGRASPHARPTEGRCGDCGTTVA